MEAAKDEGRMQMTQSDRPSARRQTAMGLAVLMFCVSLLTGNAAGGPVTGPGNRPDVLNATVTIKTQEAADCVVGGIRGIDVSKWQGTINWERVAQDDVAFVFARASLGMKPDETFVGNATGAHEAGLKVGAYHYAKFTDRASMLREVNLFLSQLKKVEITYPVVLDVEAHRGMSRSTLTTLCIEFMEECKQAGYNVLLYSYNNFIKACFDLDQLSDYGLWVANYLEEPNFGQKVWQHTSYGSVSGISGRVDINIAYEDLSIRKGIKVDSQISRSIKETLNERYNAGLPLDSLSMTEMNRAVAEGLQYEIARQFEMAYPISGTIDERTLDYLSSIDYVCGQTQGNITYLLQVKLFYMGLYTQALNGAYDDYMAQVVMEFQQTRGLPANGEITASTLRTLLYN